MRLYSGPLSLFTGKVRIALAEKGIACELVSVPFSRATGYEPKHPEVVRINPKEQVPVLVDGDLELYDSTLILEYLEDARPTPPLYPHEPVARARCRQLELAADEVLFPHVLELIRETFYKRDPAERDAGRVERAQRGIVEHYDALERRAPRDGYLCGAFTVADIGYFLTLTFATNLGAGLTDAHPKLRAWAARMFERPSVQAEVQGLMGAAAA
jgi:glutathione S-transferase